MTLRLMALANVRMMQEILVTGDQDCAESELEKNNMLYFLRLKEQEILEELYS